MTCGFQQEGGELLEGGACCIWGNTRRVLQLNLRGDCEFQIANRRKLFIGGGGGRGCRLLLGAGSRGLGWREWAWVEQEGWALGSWLGWVLEDLRDVNALGH